MSRLFLHSYVRLNKIDQMGSDYIPAKFNQRTVNTGPSRQVQPLHLSFNYGLMRRHFLMFSISRLRLRLIVLMEIILSGTRRETL